MNIGIDKNMKKLSTVLKSRGFQVTEIDYVVKAQAQSQAQSESIVGAVINNKSTHNNYNMYSNKKIDVYIYYEDVFHSNFYNGVKSNMLNCFIPSEEGALLINASNKTIEQIISIIEAGVYSPIFTESNSSLF